MLQHRLPPQWLPSHAQAKEGYTSRAPVLSTSGAARDALVDAQRKLDSPSFGDGLTLDHEGAADRVRPGSRRSPCRGGAGQRTDRVGNRHVAPRA